MRSPINRIVSDLTAALNRMRETVDESAREARGQAASTIIESIQGNLPEADVLTSNIGSSTVIDVRDQNLLARELGSFDRPADQPVLRALEIARERFADRNT